MNIKKFLLKITGIADLMQRIKNLEIQKNRLQIYCDQLNKDREQTNLYIDSVRQENRLILDHIKFLNNNFDVGADIDRRRQDEIEGKIIIFYRGNERHRPEVKEIYFTHHEYRDLVRILQGFGKKSIIDSPMNFRNIDFKY